MCAQWHHLIPQITRDLSLAAAVVLGLDGDRVVILDVPNELQLGKLKRQVVEDRQQGDARHALDGVRHVVGFGEHEREDVIRIDLQQVRQCAAVGIFQSVVYIVHEHAFVKLGKLLHVEALDPWRTDELVQVVLSFEVLLGGNAADDN
jgi:hypothetical protein